eukprot:7010360-Pyramimonas_sp.AAC.1
MQPLGKSAVFSGAQHLEAFVESSAKSHLVHVDCWALLGGSNQPCAALSEASLRSDVWRALD